MFLKVNKFYDFGFYYKLLIQLATQLQQFLLFNTIKCSMSAMSLNIWVGCLELMFNTNPTYSCFLITLDIYQ